jgi:hypothetical protein
MEKLAYALKKNFDEAQKAYALTVEAPAQEVIANAKPQDLLALRIEPHSPPVIKNATIVTRENFSDFLKRV